MAARLGRGQGSLAEAVERASRRKGLRLIGPQCLGIMVPRAQLNASFAAHMADSSMKNVRCARGSAASHSDFSSKEELLSRVDETAMPTMSVLLCNPINAIR